jgi:putative aldouronate transport system substrate-binding protein
MKKTGFLFVLPFLMAAGGLFAGGRQAQTASSDSAVFTLLVDADQAPGAGWYELYNVIARETGVKADFKIFPYQTAVEQKNIMLSTGGYTDAMGGWILNDNDIMTLSSEGVIIPLEDLIAGTKNIKEALAVPGARTSMTLPDGHIYSPPYLVEEPLVSFNPWINQAWLDQLGLKMPSTTEEFRQVLIAFRDRIGAVNGRKVVPFSGTPNNLHLGTLAGWFGVNASGAGSNGGYFAVINGRIESTIIRPEYKEFLKWFAGLYKEGLIDPELFTQDEQTWNAKGKLGIYGVSIAYGAADFHPEVDPRIKEGDPSKNWGGYAPLPVLRAPGVNNPVFRNNNNGNTLFRTQFVITDKAGPAKAANILKWLDARYDPVHSTECDWGPLNKTWKILSQTPAQTIYQGIDTSSWTEDERKKNGWGGYAVPSLPKYRRSKNVWKEQPRPGWENEYKELDIRDALYKPFLEPVSMPQLWLNPADAKKAADYQTAITEYVKQKQAEWGTGQANIDAEWDAYIAQLNRLGLPDLLAIKRNAVKL